MIGRADHEIHFARLVDVPLLGPRSKIALTTWGHERVFVGIPDNAVRRFQAYRLATWWWRWWYGLKGRWRRQHGDERRHGDRRHFLNDGWRGRGGPARAKYQRLFGQSWGKS